MTGEESIAISYPNRITCFIDVLGFSRDVGFIDQRPGVFLSIEAMLRHIAQCKRRIDGRRSQGATRHDARMTYFSDCLVTSYMPTPEAALRSLWDAAFLGHVILRPGYLPRGAITLAPLFHHDDIVYGRALVEAAKLEEEIVKTPRVLITEPVMTLVRWGLADGGVPELEHDFVRDDGDGLHVHVLGSHWSFLEKERAAEQAGDSRRRRARDVHRTPRRSASAPRECPR